MKIRIEGSPEELRAKGPELIKALAKKLGVDLLQKAEDEQVTSHYPAIQSLIDESTRIYQEEIDLMMVEISEVLEHAEKG